MGHSLTSIPFFSDEIKILPHTASRAFYLDRPTTIREFVGSRTCSLQRRDDNGEYIVIACPNTGHMEFMEGPEVIAG